MFGTYNPARLPVGMQRRFSAKPYARSAQYFFGSPASECGAVGEFYSKWVQTAASGPAAAERSKYT